MKTIVNQETCFDEVMAALIALQEKTGETWDSLGKQMNVNPTALSAAKGGKYQGDLPAMKRKIVDYLVILEKQKEKKFEFEFAETAQTRHIMAILKECHEDAEMGAIWGPAGIGKSTGLWQYKEKFESQVHIVEAYEGIEPKDLMEKFLKLFGMDMIGLANPKMEAIIDFVKGKPWLLVIDDAHYLKPNAIEKMRRVYDATDVGIVFCGNETTIGKMQGKQKVYFSHIFSRMPNRLAVTGMPTKDDINALCEATDLNLTRDVMAWLYKYALMEGHYRYLKYLIRKALKVMKNQDDSQLKVDHFVLANKIYFGIESE